MTSPAPHWPTAVPPASREAVAAVQADPRAAVKMLVTGGFGTGKSTVLSALRSTLRTAGRQVLSRPTRAPASTDVAPDVAIVVDDADLLDDTELAQLGHLAADPAVTLVVATQPLAHHGALRALTVALERENPAVALGPLPAEELSRAATAALGTPATPDQVQMVASATGGLPFLLRPALAVVADGDIAMRQAARFGLIDRLRRVDGGLLDTLLVSSLSLGLGPDDVAAALQLTPVVALAAVDRARASGLLEPGQPPPFLETVHDAISQIVGAARHHDVEVALLHSQLDLSTLTAELALRLAEHGLRDERLAGALTGFAARHHDRRARAARLYRAAGDAGADALNIDLADALAQTGDVSTAGRLADGLLGASDPGERAAAVRIAASLAVQDGSAGQADDLFRWLGPAPDAVVNAAATIAALAAGDATSARTAADAPVSGPPTSVARAARSITEGLVMTLEAPYPVAVARLSRSLVADHHLFGAFPDTPAALVALTALHGGDPVRARSVLGRTLQDPDTDVASTDGATTRHRLLLGWAMMQDGQLQGAAGTVVSSPHRRDALWAAALQTGVARRSGDSGAMQKHWYSAMEVLAEYSVDLFTLLPLGELWVAAARLRQVDRLQHVLDEAFALLGRLGDPVLWTVPLHWAGVHAGILANAPDAVAPHGQALTAASAHTGFARALATAGRVWLRVLADHVDAAEVAGAARGLAQFGHTWDATRLAGQAALQTTDPRVSQAMLQLARDLKHTVAGTDAPVTTVAGTDATESAAAAPTPSRGAAVLSDREREVAELLLQGLPYREIGAQLFISAKTVEHHVARIRRRLGAESRSELLSMLRAMLAPAG
ncbi:isoniazid response ATPase/transcriptional regulator IniR [Mycobacterium sp. SMC-4]|uniref:isoniazid response ATPase/transcriptional regulator IniR n=1 Tax=Mycobacterium sp. SMC-4 TaxID=2857059 RepID=UPI0021B31378|nr:isoniazid response ATPase/transcriptional regulator IniR [Mycobacterium sp. SMC-4]UXA18484.1 isoniazid response ATPase/transcriptional regulator IniR [Mycobacterium sp. SMC-4]